MPDHSNDNVRAAEAKIGPFIYDEPEDSEDDRRQLIDRRPYEMDNGVIYLG